VRIAILNVLKSQRPKIAAELTQRLTPDFQSDSAKLKLAEYDQNDGSALIPPIDDLQALIQEADFQELAANPDDARVALSSAQNAMDKIQASLTLQAAKVAAQSGDPQEALQIWSKYCPHPTAEQASSLGIAMLELGYIDEARSLAGIIDKGAEPTSASTLLLNARLMANQGDLATAQATAKKALEIYKSEGAPSITQESLANLLIELSLTNEAISLADQVLDQNPNNAKFTQVMAKALIQAGTPDQALTWSHLAITLDPDNVNLRREHAEILEALEQWTEALQERETIIQKGAEYNAADQHAMANCAIHAEQSQRALVICKDILAKYPEDGIAHTILGSALCSQGDHKQGMEHFEKAIQHSPDRPEPWLALAKAHLSEGRLKTARQTLLTASRAVSDSPRIHLALGKTHLEENAPTKALKAFQRASELTPVDQPSLGIEITQALGDTFIILGHFDQAKTILEIAHRNRPSHVGLAHAYGKALISMDQPEEALTPLFMAVKHDPGNRDIQLDYAQTLLQTRTQLDQAEEILTHLMQLEPDNPMVNALLAEVLEVNGKGQSALEMYHLALGSDLAKDPAWLKRLSLGLSRVALLQDQAETALAALEIAWQQNQEDTEIGQMLSDVYIANQLPNEALQIAKYALQSNLSDLETVNWFIDQAVGLDSPDEALAAIEKGLRLDPQRPQLYLKKGAIQLDTENLEGAGESFDTVFKMEYSKPQDLASAADGLIALGDLQKAAASLERAVRSLRRP
jgi:tetratricopeptide (TPR) repeat protein